MVTFFWISTLLLALGALGFILPWIRVWQGVLIIGGLFLGSLYILYWQGGNSQYLAHYYSKEEALKRIQRIKFRKLLVEFKKEEFRLKLRLQENPADQEAEWRLLDLLAIKAVYNQDYPLALEYWQTALLKIRDTPEHKKTRHRIIELIKQYHLKKAQKTN